MPEPVAITIAGDLFQTAKQAFQERKEATGKPAKQGLLTEYPPVRQKREPGHSAGMPEPAASAWMPVCRLP